MAGARITKFGMITIVASIRAGPAERYRSCYCFRTREIHLLAVHGLREADRVQNLGRLPATLTVVGELIAAGEFNRNEWPMSAPGTVGRSPVAELGFL